MLMLSAWFAAHVHAQEEEEPHEWPNPFKFPKSVLDGPPHVYHAIPEDGATPSVPAVPSSLVKGIADPDGRLLYMHNALGYCFAFSNSVTADSVSVEVSDPVLAHNHWAWGAPPGSGEPNWVLDVSPVEISYEYTPHGFPTPNPSTGLFPIGGRIFVIRWKITDYSAHVTGWKNRVVEGSGGYSYTVYQRVDSDLASFYVMRREAGLSYEISHIELWAFNQPFKWKTRAKLVMASRRYNDLLNNSRKPPIELVLAGNRGSIKL
jgi:hypothetical protein